MRHRQLISPNAWQGVGDGATGKNRQNNFATLATGRDTGLEAEIKTHGQSLIQAYKIGEIERAHGHKQAMHAAIARRLPEQQAARFDEIDRAIARTAGCYFSERGDADRIALGGAA